MKEQVIDRFNPLKGFENIENILSIGQQSKVNTPPLPGTPMPNKNLLAQSPQKINGLTRSEQALLSPEEKVIAART